MHQASTGMMRVTMLMALMAIGAIALAACGGTDPATQPSGPTSTPVVIRETVVVPQTVVVSETPQIVIQTATATVQPSRQPPAPQSAAKEAVIAIIEIGDITGLNSTTGANPNMNIGESLFRPDGPTGSNIAGNWLVSDWTLAPDLSKVTIDVKSGVQFHNGWGEMDAQDVVWSYNDLISDTSIHTSAGRYRSVFGQASVVDDDTLEIPFTNYSVEWNRSMLNVFISGMEVFSYDAFIENGRDWSRDNPIATGAFRVAEYRAGDLLRLEAIPNHHYLTAGMNVLHVRQVPEEATRLAMMRTGEADIADIALRNIRPLLDEGFKTSDSGKSGQVGMFYAGNYWEEFDYNCAQGFRSPSCPDITVGVPQNVAVTRPGYDTSLPWVGEFGNEASMEQARKVRIALSMAVDRDAINDVLLDGLGWPVHIGGFSIFAPQWDSKWEVNYDPVEAGRLLDEAGFPRGADGIRFYVDMAAGPHAGGAVGTLGELQDAVAGMYSAIGVRASANKIAYSSGLRPTLVNRSFNQPWINACGGSDARDSVPWDFPKGTAFSTLSRGGFNCAQEFPMAVENFVRVAKEPDIAKRIEYNTEYLDYLHNWRLNGGIVVIPEPFTWNSRTVSEWEMRANASGTFISSFDTIKSAR